MTGSVISVEYKRKAGVKKQVKGCKKKDGLTVALNIGA